MIAVLRCFAPLFSPRVWEHAQVLLAGAILAPAHRTVAAALRVTGRAQGRQFHRYHRVLSRAAWSGLAAVAADPDPAWTALTVAQWYGAGARTVEVASATAVWYHSGLPPVPLRWVLIRDPRGTFATQALLGTDLASDPSQILAWFIQRWQLEVTFEEARRHLGLETQRQWSEAAIRRTTPVLLGLFSLVTLLAHRQMPGPVGAARRAAWYRKRDPTFADALASVRRELWRHQAFSTSPCAGEVVEIPRPILERLTETLCYVA
jgi:hypothetical protein